MTDAIITHTLAGVEPGSETCGACKKVVIHAERTWECGEFQKSLTNKDMGRYLAPKRCSDCLAAEQRFTDQPPTEPGWYWARLRRTGKWRIVEVTMVFGELRAYSVVGKYGRSLTHFDSWSTRLTMPGGE